jgi:hypothetical protein
MPYCRAIGVTPRTLEVWEDMGVVREMSDAGLWMEGLRSVIHGHATENFQVAFPELPYSQLGSRNTKRGACAHITLPG